MRVVLASNGWHHSDGIGLDQRIDLSEQSKLARREQIVQTHLRVSGAAPCGPKHRLLRDRITPLMIDLRVAVAVQIHGTHTAKVHMAIELEAGRQIVACAV